MSLVVFNAGSTSIKFAVFAPGDGAPDPVARGSVAPLDRHAVVQLQYGDTRTQRAHPVTDIRSALRLAVESLARDVFKTHSPGFLAHRVVYGGVEAGDLAPIDEALLAGMRERSALAPLHQQAEIDAIRTAAELLGTGLPAFAAFDTGFFRDLPARSYSYALPAELRIARGIRRRGFHGLAHRSMLEAWCGEAATTPTGRRVISFQLGGGCSVAAIRDGKPIDTSMGYTPLEGLVMDTRCGDLDPGAIFACLRGGMSAAQLHEVLEQRSGLLGLSGVASDLRTVLDLARAGDAAAELAIDVYCHRARKYLGAYLAALGGADVILFGGGVGQHQPEIRARICAGMEWCGLSLDAEANRLASSRPGRISASRSRIAVHTVRVDEEAVIARDVFRFLHAYGAGDD
ncbi:MAG TPA: acetate/propionate family kinase [Nevskia sp.]|nr:acetate/propionate family kinase [Nevskia sp.]